jgi:hypothetical protein
MKRSIVRITFPCSGLPDAALEVGRNGFILENYQWRQAFSAKQREAIIVAARKLAGQSTKLPSK